MSSEASDFAFQERMLQQVSRTFALTIPQLPRDLRRVIGNAYLLCRIADTIEDEAAIDVPTRQRLLLRLHEVVEGRGDAGELAKDLSQMLASGTPEEERKLAASTGRVVQMNHTFSDVQRQAVGRCIKVMVHGMAEFLEEAGPDGLRDLEHLDQYCYCVAGVLGEMQVELFCDYLAPIESERQAMLPRAVAFGKGLQIINILRDVWRDRSRGVCWLPLSTFEAEDFDLRTLAPGIEEPGFSRGVHQLLAIARSHLEKGMQFILQIPSHEAGIRRYLLWTHGLSVLALRALYRSRAFRSGQDVRVARTSVLAMTGITAVCTRRDTLLQALFSRAMRGMP